jgi:cation transport ATPase
MGIGAELNEVALQRTVPSRLSRLIALADMTCRAIGRIVWLAFGLSVVLIAPAAGGVLDPLAAALFQGVAVLAVVVSSARILRFAAPGAPGPAR